MRNLILAGAATLVFAMAGSASAAPTAIGIGSFGGGDTTIDFGLVPNEVLVDATYAGSGVTFGGSLFGMTNPGDTSSFPANGGGTIASNWLYDGGDLQGLSFTATFSSLQNRVGFYLSNWSTQTASIEVFNGVTSLGSLTLAATGDTTAEFRGLNSAAAFDRLVFTNTDTVNGFFAIDDFVFGTGSGAVPEPATWAMMIIGFGAAGSMIRRRKVAIA